VDVVLIQVSSHSTRNRDRTDVVTTLKECRSWQNIAGDILSSEGVGKVRNAESNLRNEKCGMLMRNGGLNAECGTQFIFLSFYVLRVDNYVLILQQAYV